MAERIPPDEERVLADRLKREAEESQPDFSETMHTRICEAIRAREVQASPRRAAAPRRWSYAAIAAACALSIAFAVYHVKDSPGPEPAPSVAEVDSSDPLAELDALSGITDQTAADVGVLIDDTLATQRWAYLDHDARLAGRMLIDKLPLDMLAQNDEP